MAQEAKKLNSNTVSSVFATTPRNPWDSNLMGATFTINLELELPRKSFVASGREFAKRYSKTMARLAE